MHKEEDPPVVILGGGLTGLSTALHLGDSVPWLLFEKEDRVGGHARSERKQGFCFDRTGHWLHLRDPQMKQLVSELMPGTSPETELIPVARRARVFSHDTLIRYPFQGNLHGLPPEVVSECLLGFIRAAEDPAAQEPPRNFEEFCHRRFGQGISRHFMIPYNHKLWGVHPREITAAWCTRFVPIPSLEDVVRGAVGDTPDEMGYNVNFLYPRAGGIESFTRALGRCLPEERVHLLAPLERLCLADQEVVIGGEHMRYRKVVSTMPLPELLRRIVDLPDEMARTADLLRCTPVRYLNVATRSPSPADYHWLYVPEEKYPFYRVGIYTNAVPSMAPPGCGALYVELSDRGPPPRPDDLMPGVAQALVRAGALRGPDDILFSDLRELVYAYVVFDDNYYEAVARLLPFLEHNGIYSRGRYGSWTYNSMEDCLLMGREAARLIHGAYPRGRHEP